MKPQKNRRGIAMIYGIVIFVFISILAFAMTRLTDSNTLNAAAEYKKSQAEYIALAGLEIGQGAIHAKDPSKGNLTLLDRVSGSAVVAHVLDKGYTNIRSGTPDGEQIEIKSEAGEVIGRVQILVYSLTGKEDPGELVIHYRSADVTGETEKRIDRQKEAEKAGVNKKDMSTWIFRIVAIGETMDYDAVKDQYPMARQIMTADVSISNPLSVRTYSGY